MTTTASDVLVDTLHAWGVDVVFGIPGDGVNGVIEALRKRQDDIRFVQVRHEEAAAFMATGVRKGHRPDRRVLGHLRPRRYPPGQRACCSPAYRSRSTVR